MILASTRHRARTSRNLVRVGLSASDVIAGINNLCIKRYGDNSPSNLKKLFESYDGNGDGCLVSAELNRLLKDANSCHWLGCGVVSSEIISKLDKDGNKCVSWAEYAEYTGAPVDPDGGLTSGGKAPVKPVPISDKSKYDELKKGVKVAPEFSGKVTPKPSGTTPKKPTSATGGGGILLLGGAIVGVALLAR